MNEIKEIKTRILTESIDFSYTKEIDVLIDSFTPCLEHRESGEIYKTEISFVTKADLKMLGPKQGWNDFDWISYIQHPICEVKKLTIKGDDTIQGLIAYESKDGWVDIYLVESAPNNIKAKEFLGVSWGWPSFVCNCLSEKF